MNTLLLVPIQNNIDLNPASLGVIHALNQHGICTHFLKSFAASPAKTTLIYQKLFKDIHVASLEQQDVVHAITTEQTEQLFEKVVQQHQQLAQSPHDIILVEGLPYNIEDEPSQVFNQQLAQALDAHIVFVSYADSNHTQKIQQQLQRRIKTYHTPDEPRAVGILFMHTDEATHTDIQQFNQQFTQAINTIPIIGHVPYSPTLSVPYNDDLAATLQSQSTHQNNTALTDVEYAEHIADFVGQHIDIAWLKKQQHLQYRPRLSPAAFRHALVEKSTAHKKRIVLPEGDEPRTIAAAIICQNRGLAQCVLLAKPEAVHAIAQAKQLTLPPDLEIIDPEHIYADYAAAMVERRKGKLQLEDAQQQLQDSVVLGTMMLACDEVDGLVSGAIHTTANTVRPAFQLIKTAPEYSLVSSVFFMLLPNEVYVYADCAINPNPNAAQLAEIAIQSADSAKAFGIEPRIAMISYSTGTSGMGADVEKVSQATQIVREKRPDLNIDGPLQYDAAAVPSVGTSKAPDSTVAGQANVYIFPDLNTGNTTYKAVQRSANVISVGPMLQGLNKPVNDLSRGALVDDIVFTIALTAIQAGQ